jgi:hydroxymethylpyrimidine pyrophosphatase-like HAD family hydrolase
VSRAHPRFWTGARSGEAGASGTALHHLRDGRASVARGRPASGEILVADLFLTGPELACLLRRALRSAAWLDAFLLAAGLSQLVEDWLHPDPWSLRRTVAHLGAASGRGRTQGWMIRTAARLASTAAAAVTWARLAGRRGSAVRTRRRALACLVDLLAERVMNGTVAEPDEDEVAGPALEIAHRLGPDVTRVPACFRDFDQHPLDVEWLVGRYCALRPDRGQPLAVIGVRTSGCYLAPLTVSGLRAAGYRELTTLTFRPGRPFARAEREMIRAVARAGGRILVVDDPPGQGTALEAACLAVEGLGVQRDAITLLVPLLGGVDSAPPRLLPWEQVVQPWSEWSVHDRLKPEAVSRTLGSLLPPGRRVVGIRLLGAPEPTRGHARAEFMVDVVDESEGVGRGQRVVVEGTGLGYLGRQALAVAAAVEEFVPRVHGVREGLLYREGLEPDAGDPDVDDFVERVVGYAKARREALAVRRDVSSRLGGRDPVWEVAAGFLSRAFGPLAPVTQKLILEPLTKRLLLAPAACVVDGDNDRAGWIPDVAHGRAVCKANFHQGAFSHRELTCYDPVFDLAGSVLPPADPAVSALVRAEYHARCGETVDRERWLLYQLTQLWGLGHHADALPDSIARRQACAVNEYLAAVFLSDVTPADDGPLCAIDLDGVLESDPFGVRATTAAGMLALRALIRHGYRPVLATGRSLPEVIERCELFGLAGGVAEYGSVLYRRRDRACEDLRSEATRASLGCVRDYLRGVPGVRVDEGYRFALRAQSAGAFAEPGPLPHRLVPQLVGAAGGVPVRVIGGAEQTDVIGPDTGKGRGLLVLGERLQGAAPTPPYALAVGDSEPDLEMFAVSALARGPLNSGPAVRAAGIPITRSAYQSGLVDACAVLLGHRPGNCSRCRPPDLPPRAWALVRALSVREAGAAGVMGTAGVMGRAALLVAGTVRVVARRGGAGPAARVPLLPGLRRIT